MAPNTDMVGTVFICVELFDFGAVRHTVFDMPTILQTTRFSVLKPNDIICAINLQHDCSRGKCTPHKSKDLYQEWEKITRQAMSISHSDDIHYILNIQSLHNHQSLSKLVPPHLRGHSYHLADEHQIQHRAAESIRQEQKDQTQAKEDLLMTEISERTDSGAGLAPGTDLLSSIQTDNDLIDIIHSVLQRTSTHANSENSLRASSSNQSSLGAGPLTLHQEIDPPLAAAAVTPVPATASKSKAQGKKKLTAELSSL